MPIETAQIVYIIAPSGTGKSFTGDYLAVAHGFEHVDGDWPVKHANIPENAELSKNWLLTAARAGGCKQEEKTLWGGYFEKIANMTVEAARKHDRVVLSHATYEQLPRDVVIETLLSGGIKREQITVIQLTIDKAVLHAGLYERSKRQAEQDGKTVTENMEDWVDPFEEPCGFVDDPAAIKVDVSSRGIAHLDGVDAAVVLTRGSNLSYEEICEKVLPMDTKRDEESVACGGMKVLVNFFEEMKAIAEACELESKEKEQDEAELAKMKRRRSSLKELNDQLNSLRMMSVRSLKEVLEE